MDAGVTNCVFGKAFDLVDGLGRKGMPHKFRVQIARMVWRLQRPAEIVHSEDIFQKFGVIQIANAAGLASWIKLV